MQVLRFRIDGVLRFGNVASRIPARLRLEPGDQRVSLDDERPLGQLAQVLRWM